MMNNKEKQIAQLLELSKAIVAATSLEELGTLLLDKIVQVFQAKKISLMLLLWILLKTVLF